MSKMCYIATKQGFVVNVRNIGNWVFTHDIRYGAEIVMSPGESVFLISDKPVEVVTRFVF